MLECGSANAEIGERSEANLSNRSPNIPSYRMTAETKTSRRTEEVAVAKRKVNENGREGDGQSLLKIHSL